MINQEQKDELIDGVVYEVHTILVPTKTAFAWRRWVDTYNDEGEGVVIAYQYGMAYMEGQTLHHVT